MKIPIVFSTDHNYVMQAGVSITSLLMNSLSDTSYDIFILGASDLSNRDRDMLEKTVKRFSPISSLTIIPIDNRFDNCFEIRNISKTTYFRLIIHELIPQYDKIIYSDVDIIFRKGLENIINLEMDNYYFAGTKVITDEGMEKYIKRMHLNPDSYINAGFLLINLSLLRNEKIHGKVLKLLKNRYLFQDQDIINIIAKNKIIHLPLQYNFSQYSYNLKFIDKEKLYSIFSQQDVENAMEIGIIHYEGMKKPWNANCFRSDYWWYYYKKSLFSDENTTYNMEYRINHPKWKLKDIIIILRNYIRGDYRK